MYIIYHNVIWYDCSLVVYRLKGIINLEFLSNMHFFPRRLVGEDFISIPTKTFQLMVETIIPRYIILVYSLCNQIECGMIWLSWPKPFQQYVQSRLKLRKWKRWDFYLVWWSGDPVIQLPSLKLTNRIWKSIVGRTTFLFGDFQGLC